MAGISRLLTVLAVMTFGALGFADDWRPTTIVDPYAPVFASGLYGPAAVPGAGAQPMVPGYHQPAVVPPFCGPDGCWQQGCPHAPKWMACDHELLGHCNSCGPDRWYVTAGALWLTRSKGSRRNLSFRQSGRNAMDTNDLNFDPQAGPHVTVGRYISETTSIEWSFYGFYDWNARASARGENLESFWGDDDFDEALKHEVNYSSKLYNTELGVRTWVSPDASVLLGLRFMSINEDFDFFAVDSDDDDREELYSIHTDNDLLGTQIGGELVRPLCGDWLRIVLEGKAGLLLNFAQRDLHVDDRGSSRETTTGLASLLELAVALRVRLSEHISLQGGYRFLAVTGLALAPDHLDNIERRRSEQFISTEGALHLHGFFVGGEFLLP